MARDVFICPLCHKNMNSNYCTRCGIMVNNNGIISLREKEQNDSLEFFVGKNYHLIRKKGNYAAGIFGPLYLIYRKCYCIGFLLSYLELFIMILLKDLDLRILLFIKLLSFTFYYCYANDIYIYIAKRKIKKLALIDENRLRKSGGTSIIAFFISLLFLEISIYLFFYLNILK